MPDFLRNYAATIVAAIVCILLVAGCKWLEPRVESLTTPGKQVTWAELEAEVASLQANIEQRVASYDQQVAVRGMVANTLAQLGTRIPGFTDLLAPLAGILAAGGVIDARRTRGKATTALRRWHNEGEPGATPDLLASAEELGIDARLLAVEPRKAGRVTISPAPAE